MKHKQVKLPVDFPEGHVFTIEAVTLCLDPIVNRTLGEIDKAGVFERARGKPKITGIAGDVIEQSVLGYRANSDQAPDIILDGIETEVKVTGIKRVGSDKNLQAKEPMSITAVSVETIVSEEFEFSNFKHKINQMLIVYYLYDSDDTVTAEGYAKFPVLGYDIHRFNKHDMDVLEADWTIVRDFIRYLQDEYAEPEREYPRLSHELRDKLMYIDTAPKWPKRPRFRLKRSVVDEMFKDYTSRKNQGSDESGFDDFNSYAGLDAKCHEVTTRYQGRTVESLVDEFGLGSDKGMSKSIAESIVVKMMGGHVKKMRDVEIFRKMGLNVKTVSLSSKGGRTEDMKLMPVDLSEFFDEDVSFEDSAIYDYFANHQLLCIVFQEKDKNQVFSENRFLGFKRIVFDEKFIDQHVRRTWEDARDTVHRGELKETVETYKDGRIRYNPKGNPITSVNFPKSVDHKVFFRGSGQNSDKKPVVFEGVRMYNQEIWIKGSTIVLEMAKREFL